jgi:hypothetical protein
MGLIQIRVCEFRRISKEALVSLFKVIPEALAYRSEGNHATTSIKILCLRDEIRTSEIRMRNKSMKNDITRCI